MFIYNLKPEGGEAPYLAPEIQTTNVSGNCNLMNVSGDTETYEDNGDEYIIF